MKITARRPLQVARDVERLARKGHVRFVLTSVDHGGMLDRERVGAARYAAGVQADVRLELDAPAGAASAQRR